ncbi:MAG: terminase family protein [Acidobacteriota bacterium]|nr:terminase family protein [Acidobacteriota bacterium]
MAPSLASADDVEKELVLRWAPIDGTDQAPFFDNDTPEAYILLQGGWGSGKTLTLTAKILKLSAINYPLRGLWTVPDYGHIEDTIIEIIKSTDPDTGQRWFLEDSQFHYNASKKLFTWAGGGPIQFATGENPDSIAGPNVAFAGMDEPGSVAQKAWRNTVARVRHPGAKLRQKVAAGTSEGLGWLADLFGPDRDDNYFKYVIKTTENTELLRHHSHYLEQVSANATEAELQSYLEGKTVNMAGGLAYPTFDVDKQYRPLEKSPLLPLRITFDFNVDPMTAVIGQQWPGSAGTEYGALEALALPVSTVDDMCDEILRRHPSHRVGVVVYGDATGKARSPKDLRSNYQIIEEKLKVMGPIVMKVPTVNPPVTRRLNSVNRLCRDGRGICRLFLNGDAQKPRTAPTRELTRSLQQTIKKPGTADVWKKPGETHTHLGEALGYWLDMEEPAQKPSISVATIKVPPAGGGASNAMGELRRQKSERRRLELEAMAKRRG